MGLGSRLCSIYVERPTGQALCSIHFPPLSDARRSQWWMPCQGGARYRLLQQRIDWHYETAGLELNDVSWTAGEHPPVRVLSESVKGGVILNDLIREVLSAWLH